jgi:hypothetical protein
MEDMNQSERQAKSRRHYAVEALAYVITECRPDWDSPGITNALFADQRPLVELLVAAARAITDRTAKTPAVISRRSGIIDDGPMRPPIPPPAAEVLAESRQRMAHGEVPDDDTRRERLVAVKAAIIRPEPVIPEPTTEPAEEA